MFMNFCCKMFICVNSLLNSWIFGSRSGYISIVPEHCQVSIRDNNQTNSFIVGFLELYYFAFFFIISLSLYLSAGNVDLSNLYTTVCDFRGRQKLLFRLVRACFFFISKHHQHRVSIGCLDPSHYQFVTTVCWISSFLIFAGEDLQHCGLNFHWCRGRSCKMTGFFSLRSEPRAGHFPCVPQ